MTYIPKINDYVVWNRGYNGADEGWIYFVDEEYVTIETGVKPRPLCECSNKGQRHKMIHTLLVCYNHQWKDLTYIKNRGSVYESS